MYHAPEMFQLGCGEDGARVAGHVGSLVDNEDDIAFVSGNDCSSLDEGKVAHRVVVNAAQINCTHGFGDDLHVISGDAAIGAAVDESTPGDSGVLGCLELAGVDTNNEFINVVAAIGSVGCTHGV